MQANVAREQLRTVTRTMYDFQDMRIRMGNRLKKRRDGSDQKNTDINLTLEDIPSMVDVWQDSEEIEKKLVKNLETILKNIPIYNTFLKNVKGCGPIMSAVIIAEFDIHKADTVSKLCSFAGINPNMTFGRKYKTNPDGTKEIYTTDVKIRADKLSEGYLAPFNKRLRTKLCGVLASSFIKCGSPYRQFYDNIKMRYENHVNWKEKTKLHRHRAAIRYMIKMFLKDLYVAWRTIEGLPVRKPYEEEYLGIKHHGGTPNDVVIDTSDMIGVMEESADIPEDSEF